MQGYRPKEKRTAKHVDLCTSEMGKCQNKELDGNHLTLMMHMWQTAERRQLRSTHTLQALDDTLQSNTSMYVGMNRNQKYKQGCHPPNNQSGFTQAQTKTELKAPLRNPKPHKSPG